MQPVRSEKPRKPASARLTNRQQKPKSLLHPKQAFLSRLKRRSGRNQLFPPIVAFTRLRRSSPS
ncbi:hypothetical protein LMG27177_03068 [Paraburkholderia fynbosensis]|uniref:Uncharacterized protein n=1 Tax=Paraburkholderia fynbosensis TaxID=1200993 RepID=A0A6J5G429_9BURK|nr:hypothetical protein LMG27177_03068 [Paraburkholderia fynbosensis]